VHVTAAAHQATPDILLLNKAFHLDLRVAAVCVVPQSLPEQKPKYGRAAYVMLATKGLAVMDPKRRSATQQSLHTGTAALLAPARRWQMD
jgi:hypothetical protein